MQKKELTLNGQTYTFSPLSLSQVKTFLVAQQAALGFNKKGDKVDEANREELEKGWRDFLCMGLNNAGKGVEGFVPWTPDRILDEFDMIFFDRLRDELLDFSGLKNEGNASPGEAHAAS
jgi:hypothetical protein